MLTFAQAVTALPTGGDYNEYTTILAIIILVVFVGLIYLLHENRKSGERTSDKIVSGLERLGDRMEHANDKLCAKIDQSEEKHDARHVEIRAAIFSNGYGKLHRQVILDAAKQGEKQEGTSP